MTPKKKKDKMQLNIKSFLSAANKNGGGAAKRGREKEAYKKDEETASGSPKKRLKKEKVKDTETTSNNNNNNNNNKKKAEENTGAAINNNNNELVVLEKPSPPRNESKKAKSKSVSKVKKSPEKRKSTKSSKNPKKIKTVTLEEDGEKEDAEEGEKEDVEGEKEDAEEDLCINLPDDSIKILEPEKKGSREVIVPDTHGEIIASGGFKPETEGTWEDKQEIGEEPDEIEEDPDDIREEPDEILPNLNISSDDDDDDDDHNEFVARDPDDSMGNAVSSSAEQEARILVPPTPPPKEQKASFKCKVCDQWFPNRYYQRKHMLMEHENQLYECRVCSFNSVNPEKLKSHIIKQHVIKKERSETVSIDDIKVDLDELMTKHTPRKVIMEDGVALGRDASNKMRFICAICDRIYTSKYSLERHVRCHTGEKPYVCDVCNFSTSYREHMQRHMTSVHLIVHSDEPKQKYVPKNRRKMDDKNVSTEEDENDTEVTILGLPDNVSEETTNTSPSSSENTGTSSTSDGKKRRNILRKRFECAACGLKATHKTDLVNHIKEKHPNAHIESLDNGDGSKVHLIVTVSKKVNASRRMVITCSECSKVFHDTWKYKVHMRSHTGVKPFGCSVCAFFATSKMTVRDHIHRKHKDIKNPKILLRTVAIDGAVDHVELSMPQREFKCEHCEEVFDDNYHLKLHKKKSHVEEAPFSCTACHHREWARANIIIHCMMEHRDKDIESLVMRNNKPYAVGPIKLPTCQQCDKIFPYQSQLYIHQKQHTGERSFNCDICSYSTNLKSSLERHILRHLDGDAPEKVKNTRRKGNKTSASTETNTSFSDNDKAVTNEGSPNKRPAIPFVSVDQVEEEPAKSLKVEKSPKKPKIPIVNIDHDEAANPEEAAIPEN